MGAVAIYVYIFASKASRCSLVILILENTNTGSLLFKLSVLNKKIKLTLNKPWFEKDKKFGQD